MKRLSFGIGILAFCLAAATPARADFALIRFGDGHCEIWFGASAIPRVAGWIKIAITPDWWSAQVARDEAIMYGVCIL